MFEKILVALNTEESDVLPRRYRLSTDRKRICLEASREKSFAIELKPSKPISSLLAVTDVGVSTNCS